MVFLARAVTKDVARHRRRRICTSLRSSSNLPSMLQSRDGLPVEQSPATSVGYHLASIAARTSAMSTAVTTVTPPVIVCA